MKKVENTTGPQDSLARVFFHADSEAAINEQINHELTMSYNYDAVSFPLAHECGQGTVFSWHGCLGV